MTHDPATQPGSATPPRLFSPSLRIAVVGVVGLMSCIAFESFAVITVMPVLARDLAAENWYSLAFAATSATSLVGMTIGGGWADRRGPMRPLFVGASLFLTGIALCALAPTMSVFIVGRLLKGLGGGIDLVVMYVIVAKVVPGSLRPRMFGLLTAAWLVPAMVGPLLFGLLTSAVSWRVVFALVAVGAAASLLTLLRVARGIPAADAGATVFGRRFAWAGVAAGAVVVLHVGGQQETPQLFVWVAVGAVAVGLAVTMGRLLPRGTLRAVPGIPRLVITAALLTGGLNATDTYIPLFLQYERGYTPALAGVVVATGTVGWLLGAWIQGRSSAPAGSPRALRWAGLLVLCGPVSALSLATFSAPVAVVVLGCVLMGAGMGIAYPQIAAAVLDASEPVEHGANSSSLKVGESLGTSGLLAVTGTALVLVPAGYAAVYLLVAGAILTAVVATFGSRRDSPPGRS